MGLVATIVGRPVGSLFTCACLAILGALAFTRIPINLHPEIRFPALTITTDLADSDPEEIETLITRKLEEEFSDLPGLKRMSSVSRQGNSRLILEFHLGQELSDAALEVRGRIRRLWPSLPKDTRFPIITHYSASDEPVIVLGLAGEGPLADQSHWAENILKPQLSRIDGVADVRVAGSGTAEMKVDCYPNQLNAHNLPLHAVVAAIKTGHVTMSAGSLTIGDRRLAVRTTGEIATVDQAASLPVVTSAGGSAITVGDMGRVYMSYEDPREIARLNGRQLVTLAVFRTPNSDLRHLCRQILQSVDEIRSSGRSNFGIEVILNQAERLEESLHRLRIVTALGALAAALVLFLFLRSVWSTVIILLAIPFSVLSTLLLMHLFGFSMNIASLSGLALSLGLVLDNSIVVIESIFRRYRLGESRQEAVVNGTQEVSSAVIFSTLTTVTAFLPIAFVSLQSRQVLVGIAWTVCLSMVASLVASVVLVPVLCGYMLRTARTIRAERILPQGRFRFYDTFLAVVLRHPGVAIGLAVAFLLCAAIQGQGLSYRQGWSAEEPAFKVTLVMLPNTATQETAKEAEAAEKLILRLPEIRFVYSQIHHNQGNFIVTIRKGLPLGTGNATMAQVREMLRTSRKAQYYVLPLGSASKGSKTISVNLIGPDPERSMQYAFSASQTLASLPEVETAVIQQGNPLLELRFPVSHDVLGSAGITAANLAYDLRARLTGPVAGRITYGDREALVRVRMKRNLRDRLKPLQQAYVLSDRQTMVPFLELAQPQLSISPSEIHRENRRRTVRMMVVLRDEVNPLTAEHRIRETLARVPMGPENSYKMGDEVADILGTRWEMVRATIIAVILIYLVLVAATESLVQPVVIMTAVPFAVGGSVLALSLTGNTVSMPVYTGVLALCGLVVNMNIMLAFAINDRLRAGADEETAVVEGTQRRLRPILMTTLTGILGGGPMLLDRGAESTLWAPFAGTLASGLAASTVFALVLTPSIYLALIRVKVRVRRIIASFPRQG